MQGLTTQELEKDEPSEEEVGPEDKLKPGTGNPVPILAIRLPLKHPSTCVAARLPEPTGRTAIEAMILHQGDWQREAHQTHHPQSQVVGAQGSV